MVTLRADPWDPSYGRGFEALGDASDTAVDPTVETLWTDPLPCPDGVVPSIAFVDGTLRIEQRLVASDGPASVPGIIGSTAVGWCAGGSSSGFGSLTVERFVLCAGGVTPPPITLSVGASSLVYEPATCAGEDDAALQFALQDRMRNAEAALAAHLASEPDRLVITDGPLHFTTPTAAPIVGIVKRAVRRYLPDTEGALLPRLVPGTRTPLFGLGNPSAGSARYSWYTKLSVPRIHEHGLVGILRCEVTAAIGLDRARGIADLASALLPRFAGRPTDPRSPQNLLPISGLEQQLRHRLGDPVLIRRAIAAWIAASVRPLSESV